MAFGQTNTPGVTGTEITAATQLAQQAADKAQAAQAAAETAKTTADAAMEKAADAGATLATRKVNGKALSADVTLAAGDVGAVPTTRKVNGKALSADVTLAAADVGALASGGTAAAAQKLAAGRTIRTNLGSTAAASFNGTANVAPGVSGTLPVANGGTGSTTAAAARTALGAAPTADPVFTGTISLGRKNGTAVGKFSVAIGDDVEASTEYSYAEGSETISKGFVSHAEGNRTISEGSCTHSEGDSTIAHGDSAHSEGRDTRAYGNYSHAEGLETSTGLGYSGCHAEGAYTTVDSYYGHAEGYSTASTNTASHAEGVGTAAGNYGSHAGGKYNKAMTRGASEKNNVGDVMVLGNGTWTGKSDDNAIPSNCFRVTYTGAVYGMSAFNSSGADYAEFFEWADGNRDREDRVGFFVTLDGKHIRPAKPGDYILGVVSGQPCIIGNADEDWLGRWQHDEFGRFVLEYLGDEEIELPTEGLTEEELFALRTDPEVREKDGRLYRVTAKVVDHETASWRHKANPDYDPSQPYVERKDRPEWSAVGMLGVLSVRDDGTCQADSYCRVAEGGIATAADAELAVEDGRIVKGYRVLERVSDSVIRIVFR